MHFDLPMVRETGGIAERNRRGSTASACRIRYGTRSQEEERRSESNCDDSGECHRDKDLLHSTSPFESAPAAFRHLTRRGKFMERRHDDLATY
jgi:hypothetical protein